MEQTRQEVVSKNVMALTSENANQTLDTSMPVLLDFWAPWCKPCRGLEPTIKKLNENFTDQLTVAKVNVDLQNEISRRFNVRSIPTLVLLKNNVEVLRLGAGEYTYDQIVSELGEHL